MRHMRKTDNKYTGHNNSKTKKWEKNTMDVGGGLLATRTGLPEENF